MIKAEIVADSMNQQGDRLTSLLITFPRIILAEVNTHRMLSKNTSSSRAIPFNKMVEAVQNDPFIPIAWQKEHKGMQGTEYFDRPEDISNRTSIWLAAKDNAIRLATDLGPIAGTTKQLCNRLLEPFMWTTMLITGSKEGWDNFFELRCPQYQISKYAHDGKEFFKSKEDLLKVYPLQADNTNLDWLKLNKGQAEIHLMDLAEKIYDAMNESTPKRLKVGEWHIPFEAKAGLFPARISNIFPGKNPYLVAVKISTAMAARTSYTVVGDEKEINYQKMIELHDRLIAQNPPHSSPMEHCARAMSDKEFETYLKGPITVLNDDREFEDNIEIEEPLYKYKGWCRNFKGFIPYRHIIESK